MGCTKNKPTIVGFFFSKKTNHTILIKGIDWTEETMKQEMACQYKEFLVKSKMVKLEGDF